MIKNPSEFFLELQQNLPFIPTPKQLELLHILSGFTFDQSLNKMLLIKGYAGTGKTSIISAFVNKLKFTHYKSVLLAPTGRAAKVISVYSNRPAFTIHKKIYFPKSQQHSKIDFILKTNKHRNTIFIVDESSMISDNSQDVGLYKNSVLDDLIDYVKEGRNCKLIFIGDTAQLPPVKLEVSPALHAEYLRNRFHKEIIEIELKKVMRQHEDSGILNNATWLRQCISNKMLGFRFNLNFPDIELLTDRYDIEDAFVSAFDSEFLEDSICIVRSNKRANLYNQQIRFSVLGLDNKLATGDLLMVVKNNYFWLEANSEAGFIANGDVCEVIRIIDFNSIYGFEFAEVEVRMIDYPNMKPFETIVLLDTLDSDHPALTYAQHSQLYEAVKEDYLEERNRAKQFQLIKKNPFFNALQVKFAYTLTCHKSQGGQWKTVFLEQPYLKDGPSIGYYRWLYTALTRAREKVYLLGFSDEFIAND